MVTAHGELARAQAGGFDSIQAHAREKSADRKIFGQLEPVAFRSGLDQPVEQVGDQIERVLLLGINKRGAAQFQFGGDAEKVRRQTFLHQNGGRSGLGCRALWEVGGELGVAGWRQSQGQREEVGAGIHGRLS